MPYKVVLKCTIITSNAAKLLPLYNYSTYTTVDCKGWRHRWI